MTSGPNQGARFELSPDEENLLGRDWKCQILINDPQCSRVHAVIYKDQDGWWIRDNGSSNGTFVNGQAVDQARLVENTELKIGGSVLVLARKNPLDKKTKSDIESESSSIQNKTIVLDRSMKKAEDASSTLDFLQGRNWERDFFFLFQMSVKLLSIDDPEQVVEICIRRLANRTQASLAGFLWLSETGLLNPKFVIPAKQADSLKIDSELTQRVVQAQQAIRAEYESEQGLVDSICAPLILDNAVVGIIHLNRIDSVFQDSAFELTLAVVAIMVRALNSANRHRKLEAEHTSLVHKSASFDELLGESPQMLELKSKISRVSKALGSVLIRGESGSGKELVARAIHRNGPRANRPMLCVNCAAIPQELMESQLFGHRKGSFTSADRDHVGFFQQADLGTLFLDEIGELTLEGQAKLLRILEGHPFLPVGGTEEICVDVRIICATNRDLREFVAEKRFREDLFYRLSVYELTIPPLRERGNDIGLLLDFFLEHFRTQHGRPKACFSSAALKRLLSYRWPGNIRQLRNVIDSAIVMAEKDEIQADELGIQDLGQDNSSPDQLRIDHWERRLITEALKRSQGNRPQAAEMLGISRATLYRKIQEYEIER